MGTKAAQRKILSTLHPSTIFKPNPDPNTQPNPQPSLTPGRCEEGGVGGAFVRGGGGVREGWLGEGPCGAIWGIHAPKAKRWSIIGSPYLPLPSL